MVETSIELVSQVRMQCAHRTTAAAAISGLDMVPSTCLALAVNQLFMVTVDLQGWTLSKIFFQCTRFQESIPM